MKIKNTLLQAILVGVTVAGATSCSMFDQLDEDTAPVEYNEDGTVKNGGESEEEICWLNCAACGMG